MADRVGQVRHENGSMGPRARRHTLDEIAGLSRRFETQSTASDQRLDQITEQLGALQSHMMRNMPIDEKDLGRNVIRISEVINENERPDFFIKAIVIGDSSVGKTSYISQLYDMHFDMKPRTTVSAEVKKRNLYIGDHIFSVAIWDTAGQEKFQALTAHYYRQIHGALLLYDITDRQTFENLGVWMEEVVQRSTEPNGLEANRRANTEMSDRRPRVSSTLRQNPRESQAREALTGSRPRHQPVMILVGNKSDKNKERAVSYEDGKLFAETHGIPFFETSALTGDQVRQAFAQLLGILYKRAMFSLKVSPRGHVPVPMTLKDVERMYTDNKRCCS